MLFANSAAKNAVLRATGFGIGRAFFVIGCLLAGHGSPLHAQEALVPGAEAWLEAQPRDLYDLDALGSKLTTPAEAFAFVRDHIAYEPYTGVMKGAAGALVTRGANDFDRSLLLAQLLAAQNVEVHLVRGSLDPAAATALLTDAAKRPDAVAQIIASVPAASPAPDNLSGDRKILLEQFRHQIADRSGAMRLDEAAQATTLATAAAGLPFHPAASPAPTQLVWVQAVIDGKTVDLDTSHSEAKFGQAPGTASDTWEPDSLPDDVFQTLTLRLISTTVKDGTLASAELLAHDFRAADAFHTGIRIAIVPQVAEKLAGNFRPQILSGDEVSEGTTFRVSGAVAKAPEPAGAGGLLGGFGGGGSDDESKGNPAPLARLAVEIVLHAPGSPDEIVRRTIVDRVELHGDRWEISAAFADEARIRTLLVQTWDLGFDLGAPHPFALMQGQLAALKSLDPVQAALKSGGKIDSAPALAPAPQLQGFFFASGLKRHQLASTLGTRSYLVRPRLAFLRHGMAVADWTDPKASLRYREGVDLLNAPFQFTGPAPKALETAWRAGMADTILEQYALSRTARLNTIPLMVAAQDQKITLLTLSHADQLNRVSVAPAMRAALAAELERGRFLLAPAKIVALNGDQTFGWWSFDPNSGYVLGKMELGGGQGLTEAEEINEKITEWTENYVKLLGNVLNCYTKAVAGSLGSVDLKAKDASGIVTVKHGSDPTADPAQLVDCLRDAVCDALKDFIQTQMNSAAFMGEARNLEEDLVKFGYEQSASGAAGGAAEKICKKALGGKGE